MYAIIAPRVSGSKAESQEPNDDHFPSLTNELFSVVKVQTIESTEQTKRNHDSIAE